MKLTWLLVPVVVVCSAAMAPALEMKDMVFDTKGGGKVVFSHTQHLKKKNPKSPNIGCKSCHNENMKAKTRYSMADMERGKSCGMCHGRNAFALSNCAGCHEVKDISFKIGGAGTVRFSHSKHLDEMQCGACHNKLYSTRKDNPKVMMPQMEKGASCGACHNGKTAFSVTKCSSCHPTKDVNFKVKGLSGVTFSHEKHLDNYSCSSCHTRIYRLASGNPVVSMEQMEKGKSCGACHDGKTAFTVAGNCDTCHQKK